MINAEKLNSLELILQATKSGFLYSNTTIQCVHCKVVFPKEYDNCPKCTN